MSDAAGALDAALGRGRARIVALLARRLGLNHLALADDALQDAALRALQRWPRDGVPASPAGWLYRVALGAAIDRLRREGREQAWADEEAGDAASGELSALSMDAAGADPGGDRFAGEIADDELALLFAACHPALPAASQLALALHLFCALPLEILAAALLCTPEALAQRLSRARHALRGEALEVPAGPALAPRRDAVLTVLALGFHVGTRARLRAGSAAPGVADLCWESIRLARALAAHPAVAHADADALAAMLLLHGARLTGSLDESGDIVPLPGQPRDRWDQGMVRLGLAHLRAAQRARRLSRWHLLAGVAAEHAVAPSHEQTDWRTIASLYDLLLAMDGSAAPRLAHAIALAEAGDTARARALLDELGSSVPSALRAHRLAALARCCERLGDLDAARHWLAQACEVAPHAADARMLRRRWQALA